MTIPFKLTIGFLAVLVLANSVLCFVAIGYLGEVWLGEVQTRVRLDLSSARAAYLNHMDRIGSFLKGAATAQRLTEAAERADWSAVSAWLGSVGQRSGYDILYFVGPDARMVCRRSGSPRSDDPAALNALVAAACERKLVAIGTVIVPHEQLAREDLSLAERARIREWSVAQDTARGTESRDGMIAGAAVPVLAGDGRFLGVLFGADLLNRRYEIVDAIREQVFPGESYADRSIGTVTIFQGDLRISTNVTREDGSRAIGTRMSEPVRRQVLENGIGWAGRAFVVRDWYITAYEPIRDPGGQIIGALYVGLLEAPFAHKKQMILRAFLAIVGGATILSLGLLFATTKVVLRPVKRIVEMSRRVVSGDLTARVGIRPRGEMGLLCQAIDSMGEAVAQREERLKEVTRQQISRSEQLASIGRLAAGVAHEINNPLTGVLTFAHLLREKPNLDEQDRQDLELIINETTRAAEIVRGLLDFARERPAQKEPLDVNEVIRHTMRLVRSQKQAKQVAIAEELDEGLPQVNADKNQLQQVLVNLSLNACEAMPDGGTLTIRSRGRDRNAIIEVIDAGHGIKREDLDRIFEPFFTTKPVGKGTGLGLSVSYGIVQQHGGKMEVESEEGRGATFRVILPAASFPADTAFGGDQ